MNRTLFAFIAASILLAPHTAKAISGQSDPYFYPTQQWITAKEEYEHSGLDKERCYISTSFNNGFIIQLSGSERWVERFDINFRQPLFAPGDSYTVELNIPGIQKVSLKGDAYDQDILSINLNDNKDFYKNLRNSSVLDFSVDGNKFRFYMMGLAAKSDQFEKCMADSTVVAKTGYKEPPPVVHTYTPKEEVVVATILLISTV